LERPGKMWSKIKKNLFFKVLAVIIAIIIWFIVSVNNNPIEVKTISVPVQIQMKGILP
jgi:nucleoside permease NupC